MCLGHISREFVWWWPTSVWGDQPEGQRLRIVRYIDCHSSIRSWINFTSTSSASKNHPVWKPGDNGDDEVNEPDEQDKTVNSPFHHSVNLPPTITNGHSPFVLQSPLQSPMPLPMVIHQSNHQSPFAAVRNYAIFSLFHFPCISYNVTCSLTYWWDSNGLPVEDDGGQVGEKNGINTTWEKGK